jgi:hypothetical protein
MSKRRYLNDDNLENDIDLEDDEDEEDENSEEAKKKEKEEESNVVPPWITLFTLKTSRLQHLFNKEFENFERSLTHFKKTNTEDQYRNELIVNFWLAVDQQSYEYAWFIYQLQDFTFLRKTWTHLVKSAILKGILTEKNIKETLKSSDSFATEVNTLPNQGISDTATQLSKSRHPYSTQKSIGGPAAVALK